MFDPTLPENGADLDAAVMRSQLNGLRDLIDAIPAGPPGPPGEVTTNAMNAAISAAIDTTSANTNGVDTLDTPFADPDMETLRQKLNEVILNGRR